jgi:hypothetical protein
MKKTLLILNLLLAFAGFTFAQTTPAKTKDPKAKPATAATTANQPKPATTAPGPTKKDGTPDMRYKTNKDAAKAKPAGPLKKDGTPDMRYKANKNAAKSATTPAAH